MKIILSSCYWVVCAFEKGVHCLETGVHVYKKYYTILGEGFTLLRSGFTFLKKRCSHLLKHYNIIFILLGIHTFQEGVQI